MNVKVKESFEKTRHDKNSDKSKKYILILYNYICMNKTNYFTVRIIYHICEYNYSYSYMIIKYK